MTSVACSAATTTFEEVDPPSAPAAIIRDATCPTSAEGMGLRGPNGILGAGSIPDKFQATSVLQCAIVDVRPLSGSRSTYTIEERVAKVSTPLIDALEMKDLRSVSRSGDSSSNCSADEESWPVIFLLDRKRSGIIPRLPHNQCGKPRTEVLETLSSLNFSVERTFSIVVDSPAGRTG